MNFLAKNIVAGLWALVLGEVLAYITAQLESMSPDYGVVGWVSVIMGLVVINCVDKISADANPSKAEK